MLVASLNHNAPKTQPNEQRTSRIHFTENIQAL